jgi:Uma2 family endonuclease
MVAARENLPKLTPEEYFVWEEQQEGKFESVEGEVFAMSHGTLNHARIGGKLTTVLNDRSDDLDWQVFNSDVRIKIPASERYVHADASVTCDERDWETPQFITHPCLIVEVLSPSTESYDRGDKFELYRRSTSLREYALVSADKIAIDLHRKDDLNRWQSIYFRAGDTVELESINLTFPIERVYRGIEF